MAFHGKRTCSQGSFVCQIEYQHGIFNASRHSWIGDWCEEKTLKFPGGMNVAPVSDNTVLLPCCMLRLQWSSCSCFCTIRANGTPAKKMMIQCYQDNSLDPAQPLEVCGSYLGVGEKTWKFILKVVVPVVWNNTSPPVYIDLPWRNTFRTSSITVLFCLWTWKSVCIPLA